MNLPRRQKQLYDLLLGRGDVSIADIFLALTERFATLGETTQSMQRRVTPYISALNKNLVDHGLKVEPGALKNTYRLVATS
jgi:hypothetical protein